MAPRIPAPNILRWVLLLLAPVAIGCRTMIGFPSPPASPTGPPRADVVRVCAALDSGASAADVDAQLQRWNRANSGGTGIRFELAEARSLARSGERPSSSGNAYPMGNLEEPCDRQIYLLRGNRGDYLGGLASTVTGIPVVLGSVDDNTGTAAMVQASWVAPVLQVGTLMSPSAVFQHELWHLLGCPHALTRTECYVRIAILRTAYGRSDRSFFPAMSPVAKRMPVLSSREIVNRFRATGGHLTGR